MMSKVKIMWDGHRQRFSLAKHRINLNSSDATLIHAIQYGAGPRQRQLEKEKIVQMLRVGVAEPASTEWASPIVFSTKERWRLSVLCRLLLPERSD